MTEVTPTLQREPRLRDRIIRRIVRFAVFFLYEDVEVYRPPDLDLRRQFPVLAVSNHFGGFADPFLLVYAAPVVPSIIARDKIWKIPVAGWIMNWIGAIPVHKPEEHKGEISNKDMFSSCYEALDAGRPLLIFPEGITREDPSIAPLRTGAARIALGARTEGTGGIRILPIGIHYEDKAALRSRVFINAGVPIDLDAEIDRYVVGGHPTPENRRAVHRLTEDIELHLRRVAPDFEDWHEAKALTMAAEVTLRAEGEEPPNEVSISERDRLAAALGRANDSAKAEVVAASDAYGRDLAGIRLTDEEVYEKMGAGGFLWYLVKTVLALLVAVPLALVGLPVNFWPIAGVGAMNLLPIGPAVKATLKPAGAILFFLITWGLALWGAFDQGVWYGIATIVMLPLSLAALIFGSERLLRLLRAAAQWGRARRIEQLTREIAAHRSAVVETVRAAVPQRPI